MARGPLVLYLAFLRTILAVIATPEKSQIKALGASELHRPSSGGRMTLLAPTGSLSRTRSSISSLHKHHPRAPASASSVTMSRVTRLLPRRTLKIAQFTEILTAPFRVPPSGACGVKWAPLAESDFRPCQFAPPRCSIGPCPSRGNPGGPYPLGEGDTKGPSRRT